VSISAGESLSESPLEKSFEDSSSSGGCQTLAEKLEEP